jgi:hypothetical protein
VEVEVAIVTVDVPNCAPAITPAVAPAGRPVTTTGSPPVKAQVLVAFATAE